MLGTIGCVNVFDVRLDIVITQSRAPVLVGCALIVDVLSWSRIFEGMASALYTKRKASGDSFSNSAIRRSNKVKVEGVTTRIRASGD